MIAELIGALIASIYGIGTAFRNKMPLFYKIILFSMLTCFMGNIYTLLYEFLWQQGDRSFHVGHLGYIGMFFFLFSSYYGAFDSLADGKQPKLRRFRLFAGLVAVLYFAVSVFLMALSGKELWRYLVLLPMSFTLYFAAKHLIIPDVDMGIIKVMRPYNALIIALCIVMMLGLFSAPGSKFELICSIGTGFLMAACLPIARNGVRKWFI